MRTIEEIEAMIKGALVEQSENEDNGYDSHCFDEGMLSGLRVGLRMVKEGKTSEEITDYGLTDERNYRSHGDDCLDHEQSSFTSAILWVGEQYDWTPEGDVIYREGNKLGFNPDGTERTVNMGGN